MRLPTRKRTTQNNVQAKATASAYISGNKESQTRKKTILQYRPRDFISKAATENRHRRQRVEQTQLGIISDLRNKVCLSEADRGELRLQI